MTTTLPEVIRLRKWLGTLGNGTVGNVRRMDESWRNLEGSWDRLRWARKRKHETAKDAALAMGVKEGTYRAYERQPGSSKWIALDHTHAFHLAKRLGVRWEWLLLGEGEPFGQNAGGPEERVMRAMANASPDKRESLAAAIEALLKTGT